jgi:transcriptional regulator with XRE-family HTH domain
MVEQKDIAYSKLRFGLALKKVLEEKKAKGLQNKAKGLKDHNLINSFGKLESSSGLRKATLVDIATGSRSASFSTIAAILDAFEMTLTEFGSYYDNISDKEVSEYKKEIEKTRKERLQPKPIKKKK